MKSVILDTNFIITCVKQKIDFFSEIPFMGLEIFIPEQVIEEIKSIIINKNKDKKMADREIAELSLKIIEKNKCKFHQMDLKDKYVDRALIKLSKSNSGFIFATLDKKLKGKIKASKLVIRGKKKLEIM